MTVRRIVANLASDRPEQSRAFWHEALGLEVAMDMGWIITFGSSPAPQLSVMSEGRSGTEVPVVSVEVDDLDTTLAAMRTGGHEVVYGAADEPWGVRRFFVRAPSGHLVNVLAHA